MKPEEERIDDAHDGVVDLAIREVFDALRAEPFEGSGVAQRAERAADGSVRATQRSCFAEQEEPSLPYVRVSSVT